MIQIDNFLRSYSDLKKYAKTADFRDIINPVDGVIYPHICDSIPDGIKSEIFERIAYLFGKEPENVTIFMRRSPAGVNCPHIIHNDLSMGRYSFMLYLQDMPDAGTAIVRHRETGMMYQPESAKYVDIAVCDQNKPENWEVAHKFTMKENSVAIFNAAYFHCALPIGGFGDGAEARTVLTVFFS